MRRSIEEFPELKIQPGVPNRIAYRGIRCDYAHVINGSGSERSTARFAGLIGKVTQLGTSSCAAISPSSNLTCVEISLQQ
jgi:hypothetical protein